jgi:nucleotide-binding universal stress UspA family protein
MKPNKTSRPSAAAKLIVTDKSGRRTASAPAEAMTPLQFHIGRILVPVDFSEHSQKALRYALAFAAQFGAEVTLVHIVEQMVYPGDWMYPPLAATDFATEKREQVLERLRALDAGSGVKTKHVVRLGRAWQEVVEIAREQKADMIILATHGYTGIKHVLLGSVAEKILRHAPCPVLSVRADERDFL